jgi:hypothetical protein
VISDGQLRENFPPTSGSSAKADYNRLEREQSGRDGNQFG